MTTCGACLNRYDLSRQSQVCPHEKRKPLTDTQRVIDYFRSHPGATRGEAQQALNWIHVTARMSDARVQGITFEKWRDGKAWRFRVVDEPVQLVAWG